MGINLLPKEFKAKSPKSTLGKFGAESKYLLYPVALAFAILISAHLCLAIIGIAKTLQFKALNNKWKKLEPQKQMLANLNNEYSALTYDNKIIQALNIRKINWSQKLNRLSLDLPGGIWFNEVSLSSKNLFLRGSAVSLQKEEMNLINEFIDKLKKDQDFFKDFNNLDLTSVQRRTFGGYDVVDFVLVGTLK